MNPSQNLPHCQRFISRNAAFNKHAAGRGRQIKRYISGRNLDQAIALHHALADSCMPDRDGYWNAGKVEVGEAEFNQGQNISAISRAW